MAGLRGLPAGDYLRFAQMLANKGGWQASGRAVNTRPPTISAEFRQRPKWIGAPATPRLGVAVRRQDGISPINGSAGDYHWGGAYGTFFWVDPKEELVAVFMAHTPGVIRQHYRALLGAMVMQAIDK